MLAVGCCWRLWAAAIRSVPLPCLSSKAMLCGTAGGGPGMGPAVPDDNRGEVDVVGLITHSEGRKQSPPFSTDAAAVEAFTTSLFLCPHVPGFPFHFLCCFVSLFLTLKECYSFNRLDNAKLHH